MPPTKATNDSIRTNPIPRTERAKLDWLSTVRLGWLLGGIAGLLVLVTLGGPGLTIDEPLDVRPGRNYLTLLRNHGLRFFSRDVVERTYRDNAEHPPLGRWLLGIASTLGEPFQIQWEGADPTGVYVGAGRLAPALAFAITVGVVVVVAGNRWGRVAGGASGLSLLLMPRVFAHAHLAALDTFITLFWTLALFAAHRALESQRPVRAGVGAGLVWGLAILTKIHAWLLPPLIGVWAVFRLGPKRGIAFLGVWTMAGLIVFGVGWPWLWFDTGARLAAYFGTTGATRTSIHPLYFGQVYADRDIPWHYPWFYFAVTVPLGLQLLGLIGVWRGVRDRRLEPLPLLLLASIGLFLVLFSTRTPVYDGERLFLNVFPAWAILIGLGFSSLWARWPSRRSHVALLGFVLIQGYGLAALHPFGLSYYNALVGGLRGAERLGLELTYWNDPVDRVLLDRMTELVQRGEKVALAPTLYPGQGVMTTTSPMVRRDVILGDQEAGEHADWLVVSRREAYWPNWLRSMIQSSQVKPVFTRSRQGIWLSALWRLDTAPRTTDDRKPEARPPRPRL